MKQEQFIVIIFGLIILIMLIILYFINQLLNQKKKVEDDFLTVSNYFNERVELIQKLINFIKDNLKHEEEFIKQLENSIIELNNLTLKDDYLKKIKDAEMFVMKFTTLDEVYSFLEKEEKYMELKQEVFDNQGRIDYAMAGYDGKVENYNNYKNKKYFKILSILLKLPNYDYYNKR